MIEESSALTGFRESRHDDAGNLGLSAPPLIHQVDGKNQPRQGVLGIELCRNNDEEVMQQQHSRHELVTMATRLVMVP